MSGIPLNLLNIKYGSELIETDQKWLKADKGSTLEFDAILHYQKRIVALNETDRLIKEIDEIEREEKA